MPSTDTEDPKVTERLDQLIAEQIQTRLAVAQLAAIITGERVRVPLPLHLWGKMEEQRRTR